MNEIAEAQHVEEHSPRREPETKEELLERLLNEHIVSKLEELEKINHQHFEMMNEWENELDHLKAEGNQFEKWVRLKEEGRTRPAYRNSYLSLKGLTKIGASNHFARVSAFKLIDAPTQAIPDYGEQTSSSSTRLSTQTSQKLSQSISIPKSPTRGGLSRNLSDANIGQKIGKVGAATSKGSIASKPLLVDMVNSAQDLKNRRAVSPTKGKSTREILSQSMIEPSNKSIHATPARSKIVTPREKATNKSVVIEKPEEKESRVPKKLTIPSSKLAGNKAPKQEEEPKPKQRASEPPKQTKPSDRTKSPERQLPRQESKKTIGVNEKTSKAGETTKGKTEITKGKKESKGSEAKTHKPAEKSIDKGLEKTIVEKSIEEEQTERKDLIEKSQQNTVSTEESKNEGHTEKTEAPSVNPVKENVENVAEKTEEATKTESTTEKKEPEKQEEKPLADNTKEENAKEEIIKPETKNEEEPQKKPEEEKQEQNPSENTNTETATNEKTEEISQPEQNKEEELTKVIEKSPTLEKLKQKIESKSKDLVTYIKEKSTQLEQKISKINEANELSKQEGEIQELEDAPLKFSKTTMEIIDMVEDEWIDELIEKEEIDKRVYVVLYMYLLIMGQESIPDINKEPKDFWKRAATYLKSEKDIREELKKLQEIGNKISIKDQILLDKLNKSGEAILEASTYDEIDAFVGCLSYLMKEICEFHGIQGSEKTTAMKQKSRARLFKFNERKAAYYQQKLETLKQLANTYEIKLN